MLKLDNIHIHLKAARKEKGLTQAEVARRSGITPAQITRFERDKEKPGLRLFVAMANALDQSADSLLK